MTTTMERAAIVPPALGPDQPTACPSGVSWCTADPDWHQDEAGSCHDASFVILPTGTIPCTRHDDGYHPGASEVWLNISREDVDGQIGQDHIYLAPHNAERPQASCEEANLGLDEAEQLAYELLRMVAAARGTKRAADLRLGDVVVINGVAQTITGIQHDSVYCPNWEAGVHECGGSVTVETDLSGDCEPAATYELDDLVDVRAEVTP